MSKSITQDMRYRQSLMQYAAKYGVSRASRKYNKSRSYMLSLNLSLYKMFDKPTFFFLFVRGRISTSIIAFLPESIYNGSRNFGKLLCCYGTLSAGSE